MRRALLFLLLITSILLAQGQTNEYDKGFKKGYEEGYCYNIYGCIPPIAPISPIPRVNESSSSYNDGYNRGFTRGKADKEARNEGNSQSSSRGYKTASPTHIDYATPMPSQSTLNAFAEISRKRDGFLEAASNDLDNKRWSSAVNNCNKAIKVTYPRYHDVNGMYAMMSIAYIKLGNLDNALTCAKRMNGKFGRQVKKDVKQRIKNSK